MKIPSDRELKQLIKRELTAAPAATYTSELASGFGEVGGLIGLRDSPAGKALHPWFSLAFLMLRYEMDDKPNQKTDGTMLDSLAKRVFQETNPHLPEEVSLQFRYFVLASWRKASEFNEFQKRKAMRSSAPKPAGGGTSGRRLHKAEL